MAKREQGSTSDDAGGSGGGEQPSVSAQPSSAQPSSAQPTFEEAFAGLRETVEALEAGDLPLAEATRLYEKGMALAKACNEALTTAELRITKLQQDYAAEAATAAQAGDDFPEPDPPDDPEP